MKLIFPPHFLLFHSPLCNLDLVLVRAHYICIQCVCVALMSVTDHFPPEQVPADLRISLCVCVWAVQFHLCVFVCLWWSWCLKERNSQDTLTLMCSLSLYSLPQIKLHFELILWLSKVVHRPTPRIFLIWFCVLLLNEKNISASPTFYLVILWVKVTPAWAVPYSFTAECH